MEAIRETRSADSSAGAQIIPAPRHIASRAASFFQRIESSVVIGTILLVTFFLVGTDGRWLYEIPGVLRITTAVGIVAVGQALLLTSGEVDLSVGAVFAFVGVAFIWLLSNFSLGLLPAAILAGLLGCVLGFVNGFITVRFQVPSLIVTLGGLFVFRGLVYLQTEGLSVSLPHPYRHILPIDVLQSSLFGINVTFAFLVVVAAVFVFVLGRTRLGSHILAVGGNAAAASANGISPGATRIKAFIICSGLAGLAGIVVACQEGSLYASSGDHMELDTIAAAVIGGCTLTGGLGSVWGTVLGVFALSTLKGGLVLMGAPTSWYIAFAGAILIAFLALSKLLKPKADDD